jgi:hypothetical protein
MEHQDLAQAAAVLGAFGSPLLILARERVSLLVGLALVLAAEIGLTIALVPDAPRLVLHSPLRLGAAAVAGLAVLLLAAAFVRRPGAATIVILAAAPFRISMSLGNAEASLLVPLYVALAAAAVALAYRVLRGLRLPAVPLLVAVPASGLIGLAGVSLLWTRDLRAGTIELVFFYFPFAALLTVVARTRPGHWRSLTAVVLSVAGLLAAIGLYQAWTHNPLLAKESVQLGNDYDSFFRVTSLFEDPNVYARHVVLGMIVLLVVLWFERLRLAVGIPLLILLAAGLYFSYSQTSLAALFAGVLAVGVAVGDRRTRQTLAAAAIAFALVAGILVASVVGGESARQVTSDRLPLARVTLPVYTAHPVVGVGIGSQPLMSRREADAARKKSKNVSHTTPLTIAAELGTLGLLAYVAFLLGVVRALRLTWRRNRAVDLALTGCLTALVVHSVFYGAFFEDPIVWALAGLVAALLAFEPRRATEPSRPGARSVSRPAKPVTAQTPGSPSR